MAEISLGLLGAGRIGYTHAASIAHVEGARIASVFDPIDEAADRVMKMTGAKRDTVEGIFADAAIDGVIIATPTDLHADQIEQAARAGKAIFCEKPIDLSAARVEECLAVVEAENAPLMIGFNRRFDASFDKMRSQIRDGRVGAVELVQITSRDPAPPPISYIERSGGLFRDMMIHDFDIVRFLTGDEIVSVSAKGASLVDPAIGEAGDVDTAIVTMTMKSGALAVITNSRRATYGYDQRLEVHGSTGMIAADNPRSTTVIQAGSEGYRIDPLNDFFMERYAAAYSSEIARFCQVLKGEDVEYPGGSDGLASLRLADAAELSMKSGQDVAV